MSATDGFLDGTHYRISGAGAPVILIHGVGADLEMWEPVAALLAPTHRVVRYDMLGHGASIKPPGPYRLDDFVQQLERFADGLGIERFALAGFSMGGLVAQGFALAQAGRVDRLALLNTVFDRSAAERAAITARVREIANGGYAASIAPALERWFTPEFRNRRPEIVAAVRRRMQSNDVQAYTAAYDVFATVDAELASVIGRIAAPTIVVTGAEDQRSTPAMARAMAERLRHARVQIVPGQRHMMPLEVPDLVAAIIADAESAETGMAAQ
jgi:pimeloyl-ACP methyl ester carboxylesterase